MNFSLFRAAFLAGASASVSPSALAAPMAAVCDSAAFQTVVQPSQGSIEARAVWLDRRLAQWPGVDNVGRFKLYHSPFGGIAAPAGGMVTGASGALSLAASGAAPAPKVAQRFKYVGKGVVLAVAASDLARLPYLHRQQLVLVQEDADGKVRAATRLQAAGALDDLYAAAESAGDLGAVPARQGTTFKLWAPTAQRVSVCTYDSGSGRARSLDAMRFDRATGIWSATRKGDLSGKYYTYAVDVVADGTGLVRNIVTDPYSVSLSTDSKRSYIANLSAPRLKPAGWDKSAPPATVKAQTDMVVYELHVRDFSINDATVPAAQRGKYAAFSRTGSNGMKHLAALARAGMTDIHLLPVYDIASIPERGCTQPAPTGAADGEAQQALIKQTASTDCFNWGYDPYHYNAPEGSYASDAANGATRIIELRGMVMNLHRAGLRVGMDVVYNHTFASGQKEKSVLDRIVPGYYHRLNAAGGVEQSTCCDNTATENRMMGKLMIDSAALWAREYKIDSFRFDLMGHQPRAAMEQLQARVNAAAGRHVQLIGEGWNFGEVADGARFVQASQLSLGGSGIGTFSDRARDHVRGGSAADAGADMIRRQGYINGLVYDPNALAGERPLTDLMQAADMVRVGLAGSVRSYAMQTWKDDTLPLAAIGYNGQPAGYASEPGEAVNYIENHDNQTLYDMNVFKLPVATTSAERARVQVLGAAINAFSQGVAYFHAGIDTLRSKSLDRNSFNSGDWFNRIDWTYQDNYFGTGAPPADDNARDYALIKPLLANAALKPAPADIAFARDAFRDLLRIRASSTLFRMRRAQDIGQRLRFYNTGSKQVPTVIAAHIDGTGYAGAGFAGVAYFINVDKVGHTLDVAQLRGKRLRLHPVHAAPIAADQRAAASTFDSATGRFTIPARTAVVFVE
ncbi:MAG TPA: alpha-1,6-glucosidase domain-containing protein [Telluria sp.]|jgi:pullulanase/glycogen debranching enzyme